MRHRIFDLSSIAPETPARAITVRAIDSADFPWEALLPELRSEVNREAIPVEWADLSRYTRGLSAPEGHDHGVPAEVRSHDDHEHELLHDHVTDPETGDIAHVLGAEIEGRRAALGLAWYSGRISIEQSLATNPDLAIEVFLAEGAHMVDFFYMAPEQKLAIFLAFHPGMTVEQALSHGHDWFDDEGPGDPNVISRDYWAWVGESFMAGFIFAYAPSAPQPLFARQPWAHRASPAIGAAIRAILTPPAPRRPEWVGVDGLAVYHRPLCPTMFWSRRERVLTDQELAVRRACRLCQPA